MGRPREISDEQIITTARRCLLSRGVSVSAAEIARELGVSHTTLFNRFGSKDGLLLAALGPPAQVPWVAALEVGPDARPLRAQLTAHAQVIAAYFRDLQAGLELLRAAGIDPARACSGAQPARAYQAFVGWLTRAQASGRLGPCDLETLASTVLSSLHGWALTAGACRQAMEGGGGERFVERFIDLLWSGVGVERAPAP